MREIEIFRPVKRGKGEWWLLRLGEDSVELFDADDRRVTVFATEDAVQRLKLPSFWESIKELGVVRDDGEVLWFRPDKKAVRVVRDFLDWSVYAQGPEAVRALRVRGWLMIAGGIGLIALGVVLLLAWERLNDQPGRRRRIFGVPIVFGLITIYFGIALLRRAARASRIE
jgi:hypothetical protein